MKRSRTAKPQPGDILNEWTPVQCDCHKTIIEVNTDRTMLRYLCNDRRHGGKTYSYVDLRREADPSTGAIMAAGHEQITEADHG